MCFSLSCHTEFVPAVCQFYYHFFKYTHVHFVCSKIIHNHIKTQKQFNRGVQAQNTQQHQQKIKKT